MLSNKFLGRTTVQLENEIVRSTWDILRVTGEILDSDGISKDEESRLWSYVSSSISIINNKLMVISERHHDLDQRTIDNIIRAEAERLLAAKLKIDVKKAGIPKIFFGKEPVYKGELIKGSWIDYIISEDKDRERQARSLQRRMKRNDEFLGEEILAENNRVTLRKINQKNRNALKYEIVMFDLYGNPEKVFDNKVDIFNYIKDELKVTKCDYASSVWRSVQRCCNHELKTAYKKQWRYMNEVKKEEN